MAGKTKARGASKKAAKSKPKSRPAGKPKRVSKSRPKSTAKKSSKSRSAAKPTKAKKRAVSKTPARTKKKAAAAAAKPRATAVPKTPVTFALNAPSGFDVSIAGSFNKWEPKGMTKGEDGLFRITLKLAPGTYQYKFLIDTEWREDPQNPRKVPNEYGGYNSILDVS